MDEGKKKILRSGIFIVLLSIIFFSGLKEKENVNAEEQKTKEEKLDINLKQAEEHFTGIKKTTKNIEEMKKIPELKITKKDPFTPIKRKIDIKNPDKIIKDEEENGSSTERNIEKEIKFVVSGIIYDEQKPIVIIDDNVKSEGEYIDDYQIYKISPDSVLLKDGNNFYQIKINFEEKTKNS